MKERSIAGRGRKDEVKGGDRRAVRYWRLRTAFEVVKFTGWAIAATIGLIAHIIRNL
ncbi:hypothetical protein [Microbispora sp. ATCC PTA-5024]|uniref:hypothetical protein n=1 Tax=Microbispora sp. ATCC PTA-5024 TaxID=316330 RepID=UPI0012ECDD48|nr:hypothetical protein [Microbispora sp. ATCC PTA-5024]